MSWLGVVTLCLVTLTVIAFHKAYNRERPSTSEQGQLLLRTPTPEPSTVVSAAAEPGSEQEMSEVILVEE
jgi:hypothetical protein